MVITLSDLRSKRNPLVHLFTIYLPNMRKKSLNGVVSFQVSMNMNFINSLVRLALPCLGRESTENCID